MGHRSRTRASAYFYFAFAYKGCGSARRSAGSTRAQEAHNAVLVITGRDIHSSDISPAHNANANSPNPARAYEPGVDNHVKPPYRSTGHLSTVGRA
jgi:hypothetical protein